MGISVRLFFPALVALLVVPQLLAGSGKPRLTFVHGTVNFQVGPGFARGSTGTPITAFTLVVTGDDGLAEIEFEDGTTIRLTGDTSLQFQRLEYKPDLISAVRITSAELLKGTIYLSYRKASSHSFVLHAKKLEWLTGEDSVDCRISRDGARTLLSVFSGSIKTNLVFWTDFWGLTWIWPEHWDAATGNLLSVHGNESVEADAQAGMLKFVAYGVDALGTDPWGASRQYSGKESELLGLSVAQRIPAGALPKTIMTIPVITMGTGHPPAPEVSVLQWSPMCEASDYGHSVKYTYNSPPVSGLPASFKLRCIPLQWPPEMEMTPPETYTWDYSVPNPHIRNVQVNP